MENYNSAITFSSGDPQPGEAIELQVDRVPLSLNDWTRKFWTVRAADAKDWQQSIFLAFGVRRRQWVHLNGPWFRDPVTVEIHYFVGELARNGKRTGKHRFDLDNLVPKHIIDGLTGLLFKDDSCEHIPVLIQYAHRVSGRSYTVVRVYPRGLD